ncbi:MAG: cell division ATP-binding protein FtsE [Cyanobacteria bacterium P01_E01_bin.34]
MIQSLTRGNQPTTSPEIASPEVTSPNIASPDIASPDIATPNVTSPDIAGPSKTPSESPVESRRSPSTSTQTSTSTQDSPPTASAKTLVHLQHVSKVYDPNISVLDNVSLTVQQREFVFITGASGAGKSTLLRLLYGAEEITSGRVSVAGVNLSKLRKRSLAMMRRRIGVVFQDYKLLPNRTVKENVAFVLRAQGLSRFEVNRRLAPALKMVGLMDKSDRFPNELSGGEQQRVSLARAIVNTPPLLLADEPTGNLDPENSRLVLQILERLNSFGVTIIMSTHDRGLITQSKHRRLHLDNGVLLDLPVQTARSWRSPYT